MSWGTRAAAAVAALCSFVVAPVHANAEEALADAKEGHASADETSLESTGPFARGEGAFSIAAESGANGGRTRFARSFALAAHGGYRWDDLGLFGQIEPNFWRSPTLDGESEIVMALDVGVGGEVLSADGFVRTSLAFGPSFFVIPTDVDEGGEVGFFLDLRPVGLRWALDDAYIIGFDPLSFTLVMPVLTGIPLVEIQYRTSVYLERRF